MTDEAFADWLRRRHGAAAPRSLVYQQVELAVGGSVATCQRLIAGQMHEVYDVATSHGRAVVVRISRKSDPRFEAERWAMDQARAHGVPTAKVLRIDHVEYAGEFLTIQVQERLRGTPLDQLPPSQRSSRRLADSLGAVLAGLHSVPVKGLGYLQADGRGWDITFSSIMLDLQERIDELLAAAEHWGVDRCVVDRGVQLLSRHEHLYRFQQPVLVHGDLSPAHVLVEGQAVSGIIDFEECSGGHPVFDFVHWHATCPPELGVSRLRETYTDPSLFAPAFDCLFALTLLRHSLWMLMVRHHNQNPFGLPRLLSDLEQSSTWLDHVGC